MQKRALVVLTALLFAFCLVVTGCSDKDREGGSTPTGDTTDVTFKFNLDIDAVEGKTTVPCNVAYFVFYGYVGDATEPIYEYQRDKDKVEEDGQLQTVTLPDVPTSVTKFVIKYMAADDKQVAETTVNDVDLTTTTEPTFVIDEETPIEAAKLTVKFAGTQPTEATKYSVAMYDSTYVNIYNLAKDSVPFKEFSLEDIPLNLSYLIISWYDSTDNVIAATVADEDTNPEIKTLKIGESTTITITGDPITTGFVAVAMDSNLQVPDIAKKYCLNICDSEGKTLITSKEQNVPYATQYYEGVPTTAAKAVIQFTDAEGNVVAQGTKALATVVPGSVQIVVIDKFDTPALKLINCYAGDTAIETVSYTVVDKDGNKTEDTTPFSADGTYNIPISTTAGYTSVKSVVLKDKATGEAFEWFDYSEPMVGVVLEADTQTNNEFANGAYVDDNTECLVANPRQLNGVRKHLNGKFKQTKDIDFGNTCGIKVAVKDEAYCAEVTNAKAPFYHIYDDGCDTVSGWVPIGAKEEDGWEDVYPFTGTYDGGNFTISNVICDRWRDGERRSRTGLFGTVDGATFKNVNMDDTCAIISYATTGSIVGTAQNFGDPKETVVSNCTSAAKLYILNNSGGIVGNCKNNCAMTVDSCTFTGDIVAQRNYTWDPGHEIQASGNGGIVGNANNGSTVNINTCTFSGTMKNIDEASSCSSKFIYYAGGIIGQGDANSTVSLVNCTNQGTMDFLTWACGGAIGLFNGDSLSLTNCQVTGTLDFEVSKYHTPYIGGLVGQTAVIPTFRLASNCESDIKVDATAKYIGGLIGTCTESGVTEEKIKEAMADGNVGTPGFAGGDATNYRGKYCGSPYINSLVD